MVIHAGQLFDGKSDRLASKQVIVIQGERIAEVGSEGSVKIPPGAEDIDLSTATVLPGLIESHNHMFKVGNYPNSGSDAAGACGDTTRHAILGAIHHNFGRDTSPWTCCRPMCAMLISPRE